MVYPLRHPNPSAGLTSRSDRATPGDPDARPALGLHLPLGSAVVCGMHSIKVYPNRSPGHVRGSNARRYPTSDRSPTKLPPELLSRVIFLLAFSIFLNYADRSTLS